MEQAYRDANISFKVSNYMLLQMHNQVIIVLTNCQKQSLMQVQLPNIFLQSAALKVTSLCVILRLLCRCMHKQRLQAASRGYGDNTWSIGATRR